MFDGGFVESNQHKSKVVHIRYHFDAERYARPEVAAAVAWKRAMASSMKKGGGDHERRRNNTNTNNRSQEALLFNSRQSSLFCLGTTTTTTTTTATTTTNTISAHRRITPLFRTSSISSISSVSTISTIGNISSTSSINTTSTNTTITTNYNNNTDNDNDKGSPTVTSRIVPASSQQQRIQKRSVRFSTVEMREIPIIAGDVVCFFQEGPPITLDWQPSHTCKKSVDVMEMDKKKEGHASGRSFRISKPPVDNNNIAGGSSFASMLSFNNNNEALLAPLSAKKRYDLLLRQGVSPADIQQATISAQFLNQQRWETRLLDQFEVMKSP